MQYVADLYLRKIYYLNTTVSPYKICQEKKENSIITKVEKYFCRL